MVPKRNDVIRSIQLETTSRCNLACVTCLKPAYKHVWQERDMDKRLFKLIQTQLPVESSVHLQGWGEPLLHPDTLFHIRQLKAAGAKVSFTTSGTVMDKTVAEALVDSGLDGITFSMAGNSSSTQDKLRGIGSFSLLQSAIHTFVAAKHNRGNSSPHLAVSFLLTTETVKELPGAVSWCRKSGVDAFVTVHLTQAGCRNQQTLQFMVPKHEAACYRWPRILTQLRALFGRMRLDLKQFHPTLTPVCDKNPQNSLFISASGDVSPCVFLCPPCRQELSWYQQESAIRQKPLIFGNVQDDTLTNIWEYPEYCQFRDRFRGRKEYHDRKLVGISYSFAGSNELDSAVKGIKHHFSTHPAPKPCAACAKLDGY